MIVVFAAFVGATVPVSFGLGGSVSAIWSAVVVTCVGVSFLFLKVRGLDGQYGWASACYLAMLSGVTSSASADSLGNSLRTAVTLMLLWGLLPFVCSAIFNDKPAVLRAAASGFVCSSSLSSLVAIAQAATGVSVAGVSSSFGRSPGLAGHPNTLALLAGVAVFLTLLSRVKWVPALTLVNVGAIIVSGSLSATFAFLVGLLVYSIVKRVSLGRVLGIGAAGAGALAAAELLSRVWPTFRSPLARVDQTTGQTTEVGTLEIRLQTVRFAIARIENDPIMGAGLDDSSGRTFDLFTLTHNLPIRAWFQGGLALFVAIVIIFALSLRLISRAIQLRRGAPLAAVLALMLSFTLTSASLAQLYFWLPFVASYVALSFLITEQTVKGASTPILASALTAKGRRIDITNSAADRFSPILQEVK